MAYDENKMVKLAQLKAMAEKTKADYEGKITPAAEAAAAAFKSGKVDGNSVQLYTSTDKTGEPAFSFDFPVEMFLDQAKTAFVEKFTWSEELYPGSTDPSLTNKPVMVLAVKGSDGSVTYSFVSLAKLLDTYTAKVEGKHASTTVEIDGYVIDVKVNISAETGNQLQLKNDGLFVPAPEEVDLSGKADKVESATNGNLAGLDANGNLTDSGVAAANVVLNTNIATDAEVTEMLAEVFPAE